MDTSIYLHGYHDKPKYLIEGIMGGAMTTSRAAGGHKYKTHKGKLLPGSPAVILHRKPSKNKNCNRKIL
jgi:hypothetical protein